MLDLYTLSKVRFCSELQDVLAPYQRGEFIIICDSSVSLPSTGITTIEITGGESAKSVERVLSIIELMKLKQITRQHQLIAIGGGSILDVAGFVASIYMRGIKLINIPTTLLSMIDGCLGGKNGVNFSHAKNIIGTFYHPNEIVICPALLGGNGHSQQRSACGEILKYAMLSDVTLLEQDDLETIIAQCLNFKAKIVALDPFDRKERLCLNLGHTMGHALEVVSEFSISHGEAVAMGVMLALQISSELLNLPISYIELARSYLRKNQLSVSPKKHYDVRKLIEIMRSDKKNDGSSIKMILLEEIGKPIFMSVSEDVIINSWQKCLNT
jgi:3-dehydroquinate synthase